MYIARRPLLLGSQVRQARRTSPPRSSYLHYFCSGSTTLSAAASLIMGHTKEVNQTHYNYDIMELTIKKSAMEQICAIPT